MPLSIWQRYILREISKTAFLFLFCFYLLYILIDYAHHTGSFHQNQNHFSWQLFCQYYLCELSLRSELLLPVAVLLGSLRVLCKINQENELLAMLASGIELKILLRPVLCVALFTALLLYLNNELALPRAMKNLQFIEDMRLITKKHSAAPIQTLFLQDGSQIIFKRYDSSRNLFIDLYWIHSSNKIIKMASLNPTTVEGTGVLYLQRNLGGELFVAKEEDKAFFSTLHLDNKQMLETIAQPEALALSELWHRFPAGAAASEKEAKLVATFYRKMLFPWICFLATVAALPSCICFSRQFSAFYIYAFALFGLIAITIAIDAAHILAKRQLVLPETALFIPIALIALIACVRYIKVCAR